MNPGQEPAIVFEPRTAKKMGVRIALQQSLKDTPRDLRPIHPDKSRWFAQGFGSSDGSEFITVVLRDGKEYSLHFLQDYFDDSARLQIVECVRSAPQEFRDCLAHLFLLHDEIEDSVVSEPWSKAMEKARKAPAKHYLPKVAAGWGVMDEDMDERLRGRKLRAVIDVLTHYLPVQKHWFWQTTLRHIADGGDGKAPQRHTGGGLDPEHVFAVVVGWFKVKGKLGKEDYLKGVPIGETMFKEYKRQFKQRWPDEWRNLGGR